MKRTAVRVWALLLAALLLCTPVFAGEEAAETPAEAPEAEKPVTVTDGERVVRLVIGGALVDIGGTLLPLECAPVLRDGRTLIPFRAVMEAFGLTVDWDDATRTVELRSAPAQETDAPPDLAS